MEQRGFRFGAWQVDVAGNCVATGDARVALEPRAMDVLRYLCRHPGAVIPAEELLQTCWGTTELGDNPVHKAIAQLRRALGDSSTEPRYIETVRKRGYRAIAAVVEADQPEAWRGGSPFRGLAPFEESHAAIFYGRVQATTRLHALVLAQSAGGCPMALVLGPSGSGKTSLVRAGLLPRLMAGGSDDAGIALDCVLQMDCADLGGSGLFGALAAVLVDAERDGALLFEGSSADSLGRRLREDTANVAATLASGGPVRTAVFVDRFEAIFRAPHATDADRAGFTRVLEQLASAGTLVVLACRNDFYPSLIALPELMALKSRGGHFDVEAPMGFDIAQMVRQPASAAQLSFEVDAATGASLDDVLCDAARASPDALPLLQYCLDELYRQRGPEGQLRFDVFRRLGGIEGALGVRAEQIVAALPAAQQAALPHVLSLLVDIGEEQSAVTARRPAWSALTSEAQRDLVAALVEARLFVSELAGDTPSFGVAHEALLRRWPRVVEWIERHRHALQIRTRVTAQAERWHAAGRPRDLLLPEGMQANQARGLLEIADLSLSAQEKQYVDASLRRAKLGSRIRVAAMGIIALLAVLAAALGLAARSAQDEAERRRADAESLMSFMLGDFVDKLRPLGRLDLLDDVSARALKYLSQPEQALAGRAGLTHEGMTHKAATLQLIAELGIARGKPDAATQALLEAKQILDAQAESAPDDLGLLKARAANAFWQGKISLERADWSVARVHMDRYRTLADRMVALAPTDTEALQELSYAMNNQGTVALAEEDYAAAARAFAGSMALKETLLRQAPGKDALTGDLSNSISWLARARMGEGLLEQASQLYEREAVLLRSLCGKNAGNVAWTARLASSLSNRGDIEQALGHDDASHALYEESVRLFSGLAQADPTNLTWQRHLAVVEYSLLQGGNPDGTAIASGRWAALNGRIARLRAGDPSSATLIKVAISAAVATAESALAVRDLHAARAALQAAGEALLQSPAKIKAEPRIVAKVAQLRLLEADIARAEGHDGAPACALARDLLQPLRERSRHHFVLAMVVRAHACSGQLAQASAEQSKLQAMHYRESRHAKYLSLQR